MPALFASPPKPAPMTITAPSAASGTAAASPTVPAVMPVQDDAAIAAAQKKKQADIMARSGRKSTIYSQNSDSFGG